MELTKQQIEKLNKEYDKKQVATLCMATICDLQNIDGYQQIAEHEEHAWVDEWYEKNDIAIYWNAKTGMFYTPAYDNEEEYFCDLAEEEQKEILKLLNNNKQII